MDIPYARFGYANVAAVFCPFTALALVLSVLETSNHSQPTGPVNSTTLKRTITLPFLIFYGVGTMVGGGFYALMGKVAGVAGMATPLAFALTGLLALLTALSFAELSSRYPVSMGSARYVYEGYGSVGVSKLTGWLVILSGIVSAATLAVASAGFLNDMLAVQPIAGVIIIVVVMVAVASWGIGEAVVIVTVITAIEVLALVYVFVANVDSLSQVPTRWPELLSLAEPGQFQWMAIGAASFLAFYAMIGFEDMVTLAEEVKDVRRVLPIAIITSILITTLLYVCVSTVAVLTLDSNILADSATPLAELVRDQGQVATLGIWLVSLVTGLNGALVQFIMAARVAYGMGQSGQAPSWLGRVNSRTRTPIPATLAAGAVALLLALLLPLTLLAKITSAILLGVFAMVNMALWRIKGKVSPDTEPSGIQIPRWVPLTGFAVSLLMLVFQGWYELIG